MQSSLENPFRNPAKRATKRLFGAGENNGEKDLLTKKNKIKLKPAELYDETKMRPDQAEFLRQLYEILSYIHLENDTGFDLTKMIGVNDQGYIEHLNCSGIALDRLPDLASLKQLKVLICSHNYLAELTGLGKLIKLQMLKCDNNNLTTLAGIEKLRHLQKLDCSNNYLSPEEKRVLVGLFPFAKV